MIALAAVSFKMLFLDPEWRKEGNGYLSKSRFMFAVAFRDKF